MSSGPITTTSGTPRLPERTGRALGVRAGVSIEARTEPGPFPVLAVLEPDSSGRRFLLVDSVEAGGTTRRLALLRILPLGSGGSPPAAAVGRWRQEWKDLWMMARPDSATIQPASGLQSGRARAPILPPLFYCPAKQALIEVICPACPGPPGEDGPDAEHLCVTCGSPRESAPPRSAPEAALEILWKRARQAALGGSPPSGSPEAGPFCVTCDRRDRCYPATGPSSEPETAGAILVPVSSKPWGGILVEPIHLPAPAWLRLIAGTPWAAVRRELKGLPAAILEEIETRFREDRRFLYGPEAGRAFGWESFLLKLETLRQLLVTLSRFSLERGHPHLGVTPETLWVRLDPSDSLRSAMWSARVMLIDLAPGWREGTSGEAADRYLPPQGRPESFTPPGCGATTEWVEGLCILKTPTHPGAAQGFVRVEFLPSVRFGRPPVKGDLVRLGLRTGAPADPRSLLGRIETALPEMCRILVHDPSVPPEEVRRLLTHGQGGATIRMSVVRDHSLVDDLYAAGTLWIASLLSHPADFTAAARFRDDLSPRLKGSRPGGGDTAVRESLKAAETSRLFAIHAGRDPVESGHGPRAGLDIVDPDLVARSLALGMRLCGAIPAGYPCQDHEPAGPEERGRAYETLQSMVVELGRQAREGMLGSAPPAAGGDEILGALAAYARERSARSRGRGSAAPGIRTQRHTGEG